MTTLKNDRLLKALRREPVDATPIWVMRQAGRYLPEYRRVRNQVGGFMELCTTPELACEVTLQPLARYDLDAAIVFSDILTIPDAMQLGLYFEPGVGPKFQKPLRDARAIEALFVPDPHESLRYVMETIQLCQHELAGRVPLIGFSGSPWTLACYMVEGGSSKDFRHIKTMLYREPALLQKLLHTLVQSIILYLAAQVEAGVDVLMIFDSWGGILSTPAYADYSLTPMQDIIQGLRQLPNIRQVPIIVFTKNGNLWLEDIAGIGCDAIGVDWTIELARARQLVGDRVALQGNLDPIALHAKPEQIEHLVQQVLASYGKGSGHIFNLGHGIVPSVPPENVQVLVDAVHKYSRAFHLI